VPMEYVKNNEIVLNVGFEATSGLKLGNETIEFRARFGGVSRDIIVPVDHVVAIYARENGQGMAFPVPTEASSATSSAAARAEGPAEPVVRGLRLASSDESTSDAPAEPPSPRAGWSDDQPPEPTPPAPGSRPSLKRIK
jgi:stringent starvation protein B